MAATISPLILPRSEMPAAQREDSGGRRTPSTESKGSPASSENERQLLINFYDGIDLSDKQFLLIEYQLLKDLGAGVDFEPVKLVQLVHKISLNRFHVFPTEKPLIKTLESLESFIKEVCLSGFEFPHELYWERLIKISKCFGIPAPSKQRIVDIYLDHLKSLQELGLDVNKEWVHNNKSVTPLSRAAAVKTDVLIYALIHIGAVRKDGFMLEVLEDGNEFSPCSEDTVSCLQALIELEKSPKKIISQCSEALSVAIRDGLGSEARVLALALLKRGMDLDKKSLDYLNKRFSYYPGIFEEFSVKAVRGKREREEDLESMASQSSQMPETYKRRRHAPLSVAPEEPT